MNESIKRKPVHQGRRRWILTTLLALVLLAFLSVQWARQNRALSYQPSFQIPAWEGQAYIPWNENKPFFQENELTTQAYASYSELDQYGRCGVAMACLSKELMPTGERGYIGMIKPAGWHTVKYPEQIEDNYLYNRCHLIAWCLAGENANEKNLITGTRFMNVQGMLPFEEQVAGYIEKTGHHVMYRVTPIYEDKNLLATGVLMEAFSVEDQGEGICFCVFCYNVQPGIAIDYRTGESHVTE